MADRKRDACFSEDQEADECGSASKRRQVSKRTFENWQRKFDKEHQTLTWLRCHLDTHKRTVQYLYCDVCKKYEANIQSFKNFTTTWITGSTNQKVSNVVDHASSDVHRAAMMRLRADHAKAKGQPATMVSPIVASLWQMDDKTRSRMRRKFDLCFVMAKESLPFAKYPSLLELEARHDVDLGFEYSTPDSAKAFTSYIAQAQREAFLKSLAIRKCFFYSIMMDGSTDAGNVEDEMVVLLTSCKNDDTREITSVTRYWSVHSPNRADATGLIGSLKHALQPLGVTDLLDQVSVLNVKDMPVLVGGSSDGASVNISDCNGVRGQLQRALPWLFWAWCFAHRLELSCNDAFCSPLFKYIEEMLLRLYYLYEKSPKKSTDLANIVENLQHVFDFPKGGNLPTRCHGTRWISHKRKALQRVVDRYGAYIVHLHALIDDKSIKATDRAKLKGYLVKWKAAKTLIGCAMYTDALKPVSLLSLTLQNSDVDIVMAISNIVKSLTTLRSLAQTDPTEWPTLQLVKSRLKDDDGNKEYQGIILQNFEGSLEQCKTHVLADFQRLEDCIKQRLEWSDITVLRSILVFIDTQNWQQKSSNGIENDESLASVKAAVEHIISIFRFPLEAKGVCVAVIQDEIQEAVEYARMFLPIGTETYRKIWYKLETCPDSSNWQNVVCLCHLIFSLPFTTSRVEQLFSKLKIIKTDRRTNLHTTTLHDLFEINVEGPPLELFNADAALDIWWKDSSSGRRVNQKERQQYQPRKQLDAQGTSGDSSEAGLDHSISEPLSLTLDIWDDFFD